MEPLYTKKLRYNTGTYCIASRRDISTCTYLYTLQQVAGEHIWTCLSVTQFVYTWKQISRNVKYYKENPIPFDL